MLYSLLFCLFMAMPTQGSAQGAKSLPVEQLVAERLPDLNIPRAGHAAICVAGGEIVVFGGHTTGFVPTPTAEWFDGTAWHTMPMTYPHDQGIALPLSDGRVLLAGGHEQPLGIGQTFSMETYNPKTRTFGEFGCMDRKRCFATAAEMADGSVLIAGNWYQQDGLEAWMDNAQNSKIKDMSMSRSRPYILLTSTDNAIILGTMDEHDDSLAAPAVVDRLHGAAYEEPLLREWLPMAGWDWRSYTSFVGDTSAGRYAYILPVAHGEEEAALALVDGGRFSLLPTDFRVPVEHRGHRILWSSRFLADRKARAGYLVGYDKEGHLYVLKADYAEALTGGKARLMLFVADMEVGHANPQCPVLTPEGDILFAGGFVTDNFQPIATVWRLPVGYKDVEKEEASWRSGSLPWGGGLLLLSLLTGGAIVWRRKRMRVHLRPEHPTDIGSEDTAIAEASDSLFERIEAFLQDGQLFRDARLRAPTVAEALGITNRELATCLRAHGFRSFPDYVNARRVDYACELLRHHPDMKIRSLSIEAGFVSESSFYSSFGSRTGTTPKQWLAKNVGAPSPTDDVERT